MPIGLQRFNTKKSQPNPSIVFIKALKGPDEAVAQAFLERIAAQCVPIMREHSLSVMTVEEFPANREFVGRNFNGGEVIQLVLKAQSGRWLPFRYVQMVMMHELAHCTQMNHSRAFWAVRNGYAAQMQALWARGYTGEGLWGRGATLGTGEWERDAVREGDALPEHLCGGTYRSRRGGGKRKRAVAPTYKERKERRIMKRFGAGGVALGADEGVKESLEGGKGKGKGKGKAKGRPRVAGSVRGRELRAAAALARFEQSKGDGSAVKKKKGDDDDDDDDDDDERAEGGEDVDEITSGSDYEGDEEEGELVMDVDGKRLVDGSGRGLVRVCEGGDYDADADADADGSGVRGELNELRRMLAGGASRPRPRPQREGDPRTKPKGTERSNRSPMVRNPVGTGNGGGAKTTRPSDAPIDLTDADEDGAVVQNEAGAKAGAEAEAEAEKGRVKHGCPMCSFANAEGAVTCAVCSNVLDQARMPNAWRCQGPSCRGSMYMNAGDCGLCGLCGRRRVAPSGS